MDAWFEEEEEIFIHPKDPYKVCFFRTSHSHRLRWLILQRVDILQSSRRVRVELNGVVLAETRQPRLLFETSLPVRTYIPKTDCKMDLWVTSNLKTGCPYKVSKSRSSEQIWFYHFPHVGRGTLLWRCFAVRREIQGHSLVVSHNDLRMHADPRICGFLRWESGRLGWWRKTRTSHDKIFIRKHYRLWFEGYVSFIILLKYFVLSLSLYISLHLHQQLVVVVSEFLNNYSLWDKLSQTR